MSDPLAGLMFSKTQYASLSPDAHREPLFPTWIDWNKFQMQAAGAASKRGQVPAPWTIDVDAFHDWCAQMGATPCIDELRIYCQTPGARIARA